MSDLVRQASDWINSGSENVYEAEDIIRALLDQIEVLREDVILVNGAVDLHIDERIKLEAKNKLMADVIETAKFLVKVKRHKDTGGAWYSASWPIALRKIEEAVDNLGEDNE